MKSSVETSTLLQHRTAVVVPERMALIEAAIAGKDFGSLAEIAMKDSNQFHAICADTFPPIRYMNDYSMAVVALVHAWNKAAGSTVCGYTFDAGPNAVLLCQKPHLTTLMSLLEYYFEPSPENNTESYIRGKALLEQAGPPLSEADPSLIEGIGLQKSPGAIQYMILSKLGLGAKELPADQAVAE